MGGLPRPYGHNLMATSRELSLRALEDIEGQGRKPKDVLEDLAVSLDSKDRAFLMELTYGVLRHRDILDWILRGFLKKPSGLGRGTLNNLRLALFQVLFTRVPEWAAVHEAVEMEKKTGRPEVVNGVLRNLLRNIDAVRLSLDNVSREKGPRNIALRTSHPEWLIRRWISRFGEAEAAALAEANNRIPPLTLRVNTLRSKREEMIKNLSEMQIAAEPTPFSPDGIRLKESYSFRELPWKDSLVVQDEASQLISYLLGPQRNERILDACAAPGGKTTHIAQLIEDEGEILAVDSNPSRIVRLKENVSVLGLSSIRTLVADIAEYAQERPFDRILLDAPCSSLGVVRRNPDVKYRHTPKDLLEFRSRQIGLLRSVSRMLKRGGIMVYSVCSTETEEGEAVLREFLKDSGDFFIIDSDVSFLRGFMKNGFFRTYPHKNEMDGFFGVRLCRKA
ncbi:MAG TPA: 16S rRNA (cytosine(967)-C(5))-methyltransferase RsmB [Thermodesulfovibrionales bacterium]|nr:16S rRNA (cytosine(967)-C(5))-methyltransferase RsmB [Thermodesulfovibrionales bacterium]